MEKVIFGKQLNGFGVGEKMEFAKKLQIPFLPIVTVLNLMGTEWASSL